jgi:purine-nucleoside phosphorylase
MDSEAIVTNIECKYDVRAIESEVKGLYYLEDDDKKHIGILTVINGNTQHIILSKKQAKMLAKEMKSICEVVFGGIL